MEAARASGIRIGIGSDWSPTGSKNLLGELKVAWLYSQHMLNGRFSAQDIVAMATSDAAKILKWDGRVGKIITGARADLLVINGMTGDPYDVLIHAKETDIQLVMINSVARYGVPAIMSALAPDDQTIKVGGQSRKLFLKQAAADPDVAAVSLRTASSQLSDALLKIAQIAKTAEKPKSAPAKKRVLDAAPKLIWSLALDEIQDRGEDLRPRLPICWPARFHRAHATAHRRSGSTAPLSTILKPIDLDSLTVADDKKFLDAIEHQPNVPSPIKGGLRALY